MTETKTERSRRPANAPEADLDVRDDLRNGREPFGRIMKAVEAMPEGQVLRLRTTFEPFPLYKVLGKRGFTHEAESHAPGDWSVWFWKGEPAEPGASPERSCPPSAKAAVPAEAAADANTLWLDVRGGTPPEPMIRTLQALETLPPGQVLVQVNDRVPQFLFPMLVERGYACEVDESQGDRILVRIWRPSDTPNPQTNMSTRTIELDVRVIAPREKHPTIFRTFDSLSKGEAMVIVNDHDPRPLRYQLAAEREGQFEWTYEAEGPETWRVRIDRR